MIETFVGSVQTWECDAMGHMNVQFYVQRAVDGLAAIGLRLGCGPAYSRSAGARLVPLDHHIRFLKEQRPGAPFAVLGGVLDIAGERIRLYQEVRNTATGAIAASFITEAALVDSRTRQERPLPAELRAKAGGLQVDLPAHGAPKGLVLDVPRRPPSLDEAERAGLLLSYQGPVALQDCDEFGFLTTRSYMARVSEAIPNLVARTRGVDRSGDGKLGGAALEYRFVYRAAPRAGDILVLRSGLKSVTAKTVTYAHWLFDLESGASVATAEAVAVTLDLVARKAIEIPPAMRAALATQVVPGLSV